MVEKPTPLPEPDDASLIQQAQQGDREAFDQLLRKYQPQAFRTALGFLGNYHDAEEVMQEALLRAYQGIGTFRGDSSFPTWLTAIVHNRCRNKRRWWARRRKLIAGSLEESTATTKEGERVVLEVPDPSPTPAQQLLRAEQRLQLQAAIAQLEEPGRSMVLAYYVRGLTYEQIAEQMHCPLGTVKSRLSRAVPRLKQLVQRKSQ